MPQIWATYEELGRFFGCSALQARAQAIASGFSRRECSDGEVRVKLPGMLAIDFMAGLPDFALDHRDSHGPQMELQRDLEALLIELTGARNLKDAVSTLADLCATRLHGVSRPSGTGDRNASPQTAVARSETELAYIRSLA